MYWNFDVVKTRSTAIMRYAHHDLKRTQVRPTFEFQPAVPFGLGGVADAVVEDLMELGITDTGDVRCDIALVSFILSEKYSIDMSRFARSRAHSIALEARREAGRGMDGQPYRAVLAYAAVHSYSKEYAIQKGISTEVADSLHAGIAFLYRDIAPAAADAAAGAASNIATNAASKAAAELRDAGIAVDNYVERAEQAATRLKNAVSRYALSDDSGNADPYGDTKVFGGTPAGGDADADDIDHAPTPEAAAVDDAR